ncbi:hypothetical protein WJX73_008282 [Symbiochloris irregularis]|uniref:DCD domain-containing protein n=1 Tax=Symbiochloris irregularis TaxID=706552 RepID=A0AAW1PFF0_9CHLO
MGAGRKTTTYDVDTSYQASIQSFEQRQRNLGTQLYGVIFGCNHDTKDECLNGLIFGLPRPHWVYVQNIVPGMPIFLFNYSSRELYGIFKSETEGSWELNPQGWCRPGQSRTSYPCQVRVSVYKQCSPISERDYRDIIKHCFLDDGHLRFELRKPEAQNLCRAFERHSPGHDASANPTVRPTPALTSAASATSARPAAAKASVPGADFVDDEWNKVSSKKKSTSAANGSAQPQQQSSTKGWATALKATADSAKDAPSAAEGKTKASAAAPTATQAAQHAQREAWDASAKKGDKAAALSDRVDSAQSGVETMDYSAHDFKPQARPEGHQTMSIPPPQDLDKELEVVHSMLAPLDNGAADAVWTALYSLHSRLDAAQQEHSTTMKIVDQLQLSNDKLTQELSTTRHNMKLIMNQMKGVSPGLANGTDSAESSYKSNENGMLMNGDAPRGQTVFLLGGNNGSEWLESGDIYHPLTSTWTGQAVNLPYRHGYGAAVAIGRSIYLLGGGSGTTWLNSVLRYDADDQRWFECGAMNEARGSLGACVLDGKLYAIGGGQPGTNLASVEMMDPEYNQWMTVKTMTQSRFSTTAVSHQGCVFALGGFSGDSYLKTSEMLDPRSGRWEQLPAMAAKRGSAASAVLGSDLVVVGGYDGATFHASVEAYDTRAGKWRDLASMAQPRAYGAAESVDGRLYAMSGMCGTEGGSGNNLTVEVYDPESDAWMQQPYTTQGVAESQNLRLSFASSCVMDSA